MFVFITFLLGFLGGLVAFYLELPLPWLLGSLLSMVVFKKLSVLKEPPKKLARVMRVLLGVALGGFVANSIQSVDSSLTLSIVSALVFVTIVTMFGVYYFRHLSGFSYLDSFMSALPGGLTFLVSMSGDLGGRFPKIALIHTVRMVALIFVFSIFAYFFGSTGVLEENSIVDAFALPIEVGLWQVFLVSVISWLFTSQCKIAGGDIMFPMIISALFYHYGLITVPMPEVIKTIAMVTFGMSIGCKIVSANLVDSGAQIKASLIFTTVAILLALMIAITLGGAFNKSYLLFFLALAPGSIPEICLIAMALGFDVGFVALVHTCRYLFIMFIGALGFHMLSARGGSKLEDKLVL